MNTYEIQSLRSRMEATLRDLKIAENTTKSKLKESSEVYSSVFCDELDYAKAEVDLKTALEIHAHSIAQQVLLQDAIARMEAGNFGVCLGCGDGIGLPRLEAIPETTLCIDCSSSWEFLAASEQKSWRLGCVARQYGNLRGQIQGAA